MLDKPGVAILKERLVPLATVVTPNVDEAKALTGISITGDDDMKQAAQLLHVMGAQAVVITGGHLKEAIDLLSVKGRDAAVLQVSTSCGLPTLMVPAARFRQP